jgi:hypothetical protein
MPNKTDARDLVPEITKEDVAWLMNALWDSLQSPGWSFANRKDLEKLGEAIYSGKKLRDVDDKVLTRLFPHLKAITLHLGRLLMRHEPKTQTTPAQDQAPSSTPAEPPKTETPS